LQRRTGKTAIYVTHDQTEAFAISDRIAVMNQGLIDQIGTQTEIYLHPQSDFVAEFIGANNRLEGQITALTSDVTTVQTTGLAIQCPTRAGLKIGDAVVAYIRPEDIKVLNNGSSAAYRNIVEGAVEQIIFEGATAQLRVGVAGQMLRVDVAGAERLKLLDHRGQIRLGFDEVTLIPMEIG
jgi:ABC-type Fe3+/spermidine/putrescine transport system ATPase subunit